ncbi:MAG: NADH-quinone oxidoreductase subunit N [Candidatus Acidiferrum sp.]
MLAHTLNALRTYMHGNGAALLPEMELLLFAVGILVMDRWVERDEKYWSPSLALAGTIFSALTLWMLQARIHNTGDFTAYQESIVVDSYFLFFAALSLAGTMMVILLSINDPAMRDVSAGRFYALLLLACMGAMLMISAAGLLVIFLSLEISAAGAYFLTATPRFRKRSAPAALKFMFASALGSALLAYGFSLLYGLSASTNIGQIATTLNRRQNLAAAIALSRQPGPHAAQMYELIQRRMPEALHWHPFILQVLPIAALSFFLAGMVLKLAATRFRPAPEKTSWIIAPPAALFLSGGFAAATIAVLVRLLLTTFGDFQPIWSYMFAVIAVAMIALGICATLPGVRRIWPSLAHLPEANLERVLAWSTVSQIGYMLLGLVAANQASFTAMGYYLLTYLFILTGAFAVLVGLHCSGDSARELCDLHGLRRRSPAAALLLTIFLLSLAGFPPAAGFFGRHFLFHELVETGHRYLAWFLAISSLPLAYAYLRVAVLIWRSDAHAEYQPLAFSTPQSIVLGICVFVSLAAGLYSEPFLRVARYAFGQ